MTRREQIVADMTLLFGKARAERMTRHLNAGGYGKTTFGAFDLEILPLESLDLDLQYQRGGHLKRKSKMKTFDAQAALFPVVARRTGSRVNYVIDGFHRVTKLRDIVTYYPCLVIPDTTQQREADLFSKINVESTTVAGKDKFKSGLTAGYHTNLFIVNVINGAGLTTYFDDPSTADFPTLQYLVKLVDDSGEDHFRRLVSILIGAYGDDENEPHLQFVARGTDFVKALSSFLSTPTANRDNDTVIYALRNLTAEKLYQRADKKRSSGSRRDIISRLVDEMKSLFDLKRVA